MYHRIMYCRNMIYVSQGHVLQRQLSQGACTTGTCITGLFHRDMYHRDKHYTCRTNYILYDQWGVLWECVSDTQIAGIIIMYGMGVGDVMRMCITENEYYRDVYHNNRCNKDMCYRQAYVLLEHTSKQASFFLSSAGFFFILHCFRGVHQWPCDQGHERLLAPSVLPVSAVRNLHGRLRIC